MGWGGVGWGVGGSPPAQRTAPAARPWEGAKGGGQKGRLAGLAAGGGGGAGAWRSVTWIHRPPRHSSARRHHPTGEQTHPTPELPRTQRSKPSGRAAAQPSPAPAQTQPSTHLSAGDLRRGRVLHEVVQGHAAHAADPSRHVQDANVDVVAQGGKGAGASGHLLRGGGQGRQGGVKLSLSHACMHGRGPTTPLNACPPPPHGSQPVTPPQLPSSQPAAARAPPPTSSSSASLATTSSRCRKIWLGVGMCSSNTALAMGMSAGCATQVPSWPSVTSRSLSALTCTAGCRVWGFRVQGVGVGAAGAAEAPAPAAGKGFVCRRGE